MADTDILPSVAAAQTHSTPEKELPAIPLAAPIPRSPVAHSPKRTHPRHTKGLSLNFPILLPSQQLQSTDSPSPGSISPSPPTESARGSPRGKHGSVFSPAGKVMAKAESPAVVGKSEDFLTLLAAQERKVLELKEELSKAEIELSGLKKQWAIYETGKKREDVKNVKKMQPLVMGAATGLGLSNDHGEGEEVEEERKRRRALVEMNHNANNHVAGTATAKHGRKGSKRVFEGRHTRTLSLLSPVGQKQNDSGSSLNEMMESTGARKSEDSVQDEIRPKKSLSRMATFDSLMSADPLQLGFGKTYKDLAAHRKSLPPVGTEAFVKQGKQMVDGVREGLWTFFEDIRQATVGDEGVNGTAAQQRPPRGTKGGSHGGGSKNKQGKPAASTRARPGQEEPQADSFWKEFGLGTPVRKSTEKANKASRNGHVQQKSSTDSQNPPSLLIDANGTDHEDEDWDAWESPMSTMQTPKVQRLDHEVKAERGEGLPWPELKKLTPSKLTRTVSDLMREWESGPEREGGREQTDEERQAQMLSSPHL